MRGDDPRPEEPRGTSTILSYLGCFAGAPKTNTIADRASDEYTTRRITFFTFFTSRQSGDGRQIARGTDAPSRRRFKPSTNSGCGEQTPSLSAMGGGKLKPPQQSACFQPECSWSERRGSPPPRYPRTPMSGVTVTVLQIGREAPWPGSSSLSPSKRRASGDSRSTTREAGSSHWRGAKHGIRASSLREIRW